MNFTRAAERLRITQPALSKQIAELEQKVGFSIFSRAQRRVELTDAGQVFVRGCQDALAVLEKALRSARSTQEQVQPVVTIGHSPYVDPQLISALIGTHLPLYPNLRLRMESMFAHELVHGVLSAELDIALLEEPLENPLLTLVSLTSAPLHVLMASEHPAARKSAVDMADFGTVGWMMFPKRANPAIYDKVLDAGKEAGVTPVELHHYLAPQEVAPLISQNFGVAFMPRGTAEQMMSAEIVSLPLGSGALQLTTFLALRADESSRLINEFGRSFLKRVVPGGVTGSPTGQLPLEL